jgi:hypothetical protein
VHAQASSPRSILAPGPSPSTIPTLWKRLAVVLPAVFPSILAAIALGTWLALARTRSGPSEVWIGTWAAIVAPLGLWLLAVYLLAHTRFYQARLVIPLGVILIPDVGLLLLSRLPDVPDLLAATPMSWLVGLQVIRVVGGLFLLVWLSGEVRQPWFNLEAGTLDVIVGAAALPIAWWLSSTSSVAYAAAAVWNVLGLLDFVFAIAISATFRGAGPGTYIFSLRTPVVAAFRPTILGIVAFGVPLAIMLHILSLWQLLAT